MLLRLSIAALVLSLTVHLSAAEKVYEGEPLAVWQDRIKALHPQSPEAQGAIPALSAIALDAEVPWFTRKQAALMLGRIGKIAGSAECLRPLVVMLDQSQGGEDAPRCWAAKGLALMGPRAAPAGGRLVKILRDGTQPLVQRLAVLEPLAVIGAGYPDVLPAFVEILELPPSATGDEAQLREISLEAVVVLGPQGEVAVPFLMRILRGPRESESSRRKAAQALGAIGPRAEPAALVLGETILADPSPAVRDVAAESLGQIGPRALPIVTPLVTHRDPAARARGALAAAKLRVSGKPLLPQLETLLGDADELVRLRSIEAIAAIAPDHAKVVPAAIELVTAGDRDVRAKAVKLLDRLGPKLAANRAQLEKLLDDPREPVRRTAQRLLDRLDAE